MIALAAILPEDSGCPTGLPALTVHVDKHMEALVQRFLSRKRGDLDRLRSALAIDDFETIQRIGHDLKGSGETFGFPELSAFGAALERAALSSNDRALGEQVTAVEQFLLRLRVSSR